MKSSEKYNKTLDAEINKIESSNSPYSPETPEEQIEDNSEEYVGNLEDANEASESPKKISIKNIDPEPIQKTPAIEEINTQSKWLENYLQNEEKVVAENEGSIPSSIEVIKFRAAGNVIYDEDASDQQTPEGVNDEPFANQVEPSSSPIKEDASDTFASRKQSQSDTTDKNDIPVISYSEEDKSSEEEKLKGAIIVQSKEAESEEESESEEEVNIKNSDLVTSDIPKEAPAQSESEAQADMITNDLFYEILANIITDPIPKRDLSIFALQAQTPNRKLVSQEKRKNFDLYAIEKYLEEVIESIMENESNFIDNLLEPVRRNPIDMLQLLQNSDLGSYEHFENIALKQPVLNLDLYLDIERNKEEKRLTDQTNKKIIKHLDGSAVSSEHTTEDEDQIEFEQIHRKMVFDCINESINKYRPYGEVGIPMPWSSSTRRLCSNDILNFEKVFNGIKDNLFKCGTTQSGVMPTTEYWINDEFDEELFAEIREK